MESCNLLDWYSPTLSLGQDQKWSSSSGTKRSYWLVRLEIRCIMRPGGYAFGPGNFNRTVHKTTRVAAYIDQWNSVACVCKAEIASFEIRAQFPSAFLTA
jgi:hypothetical protein